MTERMIDNKFGINPKDEQINALAKKIWEALGEIDPDPMHPVFESFNDPVKDQVVAYATDMINGFSSLNNNKPTRDLYEYALARLGLPDTLEMRVLFWDERNDLEWDEQTDSYIVPLPLPPSSSSVNGNTPAVISVLAERRRQIEEEGYDSTQDDEHTGFELSLAAGCYASMAVVSTPQLPVPADWPWPKDFWKPTSARRDLVKAAALILAEIERLDRVSDIVEYHDSDCSTNNRGVPEQLGPCDCSLKNPQDN